jgi:quercetin dioxygenase-like cupin family protein
MASMNRRSALTLTLAAASAAAASGGAAAQTAAAEGKEVAPGVRMVTRGERASMISAYKSVSMRDFVYQPKAKLASGNPMPNDMVCHCPEGELRVRQTPGGEFVVKAGDVWSCNKGLLEDTENIGSGIAIMRVIDLLPT